MVERVKKKNKREQFLKVAVKLFSENGYSNVRLQQVADHSNCAYSLVYYYFKSKSDLFIAAVAYSVEQTISHYKQLADKYDCPIDLIGHWFEVNIVDSENLKFFVKIMMEYSPRRHEAQALAQSIDRFYEFETKILSNSIKKGTDRKLFVCRNPEELAEFISCHIDGIYYRACTRPGYDISGSIWSLQKELWSILGLQKDSDLLQMWSSEKELT